MDGTGEAVLDGVVGFDGLVDVRERDDRRDGTEVLVARGGHVIGRIGEDRWRND